MTTLDKIDKLTRILEEVLVVYEAEIGKRPSGVDDLLAEIRADLGDFETIASVSAGRELVPEDRASKEELLLGSRVSTIDRSIEAWSSSFPQLDRATSEVKQASSVMAGRLGFVPFGTAKQWVSLVAGYLQLVDVETFTVACERARCAIRDDDLTIGPRSLENFCLAAAAEKQRAEQKQGRIVI